MAIGTIRQVSVARWSTPDGKRPPGPFQGGPDSPIIFREATLQVEERVKGSGDVKELTIYLRGGQVGADKMIVTEEVELEAGEKVLVFLYPTAGSLFGGRPGYRISGSIQGKYTITDGLAIRAKSPDPIRLRDLVGRIRSAATN